MMSSKLPILISIPHGGEDIPPEVQDQVLLSPTDQFKDSDAFSRKIYDLRDSVESFIDFPIARPYIDLNRATTDRPPDNPDGVVKSHTCHGVPIYREERGLNESEIHSLLEKYHAPYHNYLSSQSSNPAVKLALDCHTMEPVAPPIAPDPGASRPKICLGNNHGKSCSNEMAKKLLKCFQKCFNLKDNEVTLNQPFAGGYITRKYGSESTPWIQVELNRSLYLCDPWFDENHLTIREERLVELRNMFFQSLKMFINS